MLRDKLWDRQMKRCIRFEKQKFVSFVKVNVSNHLELEASCQLPALVLVIYTFILNIY